MAWLFVSMLAVGRMAAAQATAPAGPYDGMQGPRAAADIVWAHTGGGGNICWNEYNAARSAHTGYIRCGVPAPRACEASGATCSPAARNAFCVVGAEPSAGAGSCVEQAPGSGHGTPAMQAYLGERLQAPGALYAPIGNGQNCVYGTECGLMLNGSGVLTAVIAYSSLSPGAPLALGTVRCRHLANCIGLVGGKVLPYSPTSGMSGATRVVVTAP